MRFILPLLTLLLVGCAGDGNFYEVTINGLANPLAAERHTYVLQPADKATSTVDLQFSEYATLVENALASKGLIRLPSHLNVSADQIITLGYSVSEPLIQDYTEEVPVYGETGMQTVIKREGERDIITTRPTYGVTHYRHEHRSRVVYTRTITVEAKDNRPGSTLTLWRTELTSTGADPVLRNAFAPILAAGQPALGMNTVKAYTAEIYDTDPKVAALSAPVYPAAAQPVPAPTK